MTTAFYLVANWQTGLLRFANAGHPKPLPLCPQSGRVEVLTNSSGKPRPALGLWEKSVCRTSQTEWSRGDLVLLLTDGRFEIQNAQQGLCPEETLSAAVPKQIRLPVSGFFDELIREIQQFSATGDFADDVSLVGMKLIGPKPA